MNINKEIIDKQLPSHTMNVHEVVVEVVVEEVAEEVVTGRAPALWWGWTTHRGTGDTAQVDYYYSVWFSSAVQYYCCRSRCRFSRG